MHEQGTMMGMYAFSRPWGARVRLLPTARFFRHQDAQWRGGASWSAMHAPKRSYAYDDFIHHGLKGAAHDMAVMRRALNAVVGFQRSRTLPRRAAHAPGDANTSTLRADAHTLAQIFASSSSGSTEVCPPAEPEPGTPAGYDNQRSCCTPDRERTPSRTHINGSLSDAPRPCWRSASWAVAPHQPHAEEWTCVQSMDGRERHSR
jgi:hypothetical protein